MYSSNTFFFTEFEMKHPGKCVAPDVCPPVHVPICTIPEIGSCGQPKKFKNFCELNKYNGAHPDCGITIAIF